MSSGLPAEMSAIEILKPGDPDVLSLTRRPVPTPKPGEILIKVAAAGVNRPDILQRKGLYALPPDASDLPGLEIAGTIVGLGKDVSDWAIGDAVCALTNGGGYAEFCTVPSVQALPVPSGLNMIEAAALPETCFTVWSNVFDRGRLQPGESFLVHGGSSGIGTTAIQLAQARGCRVFTTVGSADKAAVCRALGAELAIDYRSQDFVALCRAATDGQGVDVILDMVGGDYTPRNVELLAVEGRLVQIAFLRGPTVSLNLEPIMRKRLTLTGSTLRPRTTAVKGAIAEALHREVWPLVEAGKVRPVIQATFPLKDTADAHRIMEEGAHIGKIVLVVG